MKKLFVVLIVLCCSLSLAALGYNFYINVAEDVTNLKTTTFSKFQNQNIKGFDIGGMWNITVKQGNQTKITITVPEKYKNSYNYNLEQGVFNVNSSKNVDNKIRFNSGKNPFKIEIICNSLEYVKASGGVDVRLIGDFNAKNFIISASGGADITSDGKINCNNAKIESFGGADTEINVEALQKIAAVVSGGTDFYGSLKADIITLNISGGADMKNSIYANTVDVIISGGADTKLSGNVNKLSVNASGGCDFDAQNLVAQEVAVDASGAADVTVNAVNKLNINKSTAADVSYKGNPTLNVKSEGIRKLD